MRKIILSTFSIIMLAMVAITQDVIRDGGVDPHSTKEEKKQNSNSTKEKGAQHSEGEQNVDNKSQNDRDINEGLKDFLNINQDIGGEPKENSFKFFNDKIVGLLKKGAFCFLGVFVVVFILQTTIAIYFYFQFKSQSEDLSKNLSNIIGYIDNISPAFPKELGGKAKKLDQVIKTLFTSDDKIQALFQTRNATNALPDDFNRTIDSAINKAIRELKIGVILDDEATHKIESISKTSINDYLNKLNIEDAGKLYELSVKTLVAENQSLVNKNKENDGKIAEAIGNYRNAMKKIGAAQEEKEGLEAAAKQLSLDLRKEKEEHKEVNGKFSEVKEQLSILKGTSAEQTIKIKHYEILVNDDQIKYFKELPEFNKGTPELRSAIISYLLLGCKSKEEKKDKSDLLKAFQTFDSELFRAIKDPEKLKALREKLKSDINTILDGFYTVEWPVPGDPFILSEHHYPKSQSGRTLVTVENALIRVLPDHEIYQKSRVVAE